MLRKTKLMLHYTNSYFCSNGTTLAIKLIELSFSVAYQVDIFQNN